MTAPLIKAAGLSPRNVKVELIQDDEINAFTAGGQTIYVNSGLIEAADNANQVQGVIAHELGHVADGHVLLSDQGAKPAMGIYILSLVLGVAAAAAGSPDAAAGILGAGQQAATGRFLSFTRTQEATADTGTFNLIDEVFVLKGDKVVLSEGKNVFVGCQLTVLMRTGEAKLDACGGRVMIQLDPKSRKTTN